jgi:hypothetical protein
MLAAVMWCALPAAAATTAPAAAAAAAVPPSDPTAPFVCPACWRTCKTHYNVRYNTPTHRAGEVAHDCLQQTRPVLWVVAVHHSREHLLQLGLDDVRSAAGQQTQQTSTTAQVRHVESRLLVGHMHACCVFAVADWGITAGTELRTPIYYILWLPPPSCTLPTAEKLPQTAAERTHAACSTIDVLLRRRPVAIPATACAHSAAS